METTNKSFFAGDEERVAFAAPPTNTRLSYTLTESVSHSFIHSPLLTYVQYMNVI